VPACRLSVHTPVATVPWLQSKARCLAHMSTWGAGSVSTIAELNAIEPVLSCQTVSRTPACSSAAPFLSSGKHHLRSAFKRVLKSPGSAGARILTEVGMVQNDIYTDIGGLYVISLQG
jgi:hypothetical protein